MYRCEEDWRRLGSLIESAAPRQNMQEPEHEVNPQNPKQGVTYRSGFALSLTAPKSSTPKNPKPSALKPRTQLNTSNPTKADSGD